MLKDYVKIILISIIYRLLIMLIHAKNSFVDTIIPYPVQPDAFYYYHILPLPKIIVFIIPLIALSIGLIFFYRILSMYLEPKLSFLGTISLSLLYPFFIQTYASYTDTPSIIFMFTIIISYYTIKAIQDKSKIPFAVSIVLIDIVLLALFWIGWKIIAIVVLFCLFPIIYHQVKYKKLLLILTGTIFTIVAIKLFPRFIEFCKLFNVINELRPNWNPIWLIFNVFIFIITFDLIKDKKTYWEFKLRTDKLFILLMALTFTILSMIMKRWTYLAMPFIIIVVLLWLSKRSKTFLKVFMITLIVLSVFNSITTFSSIEPLIDNDTQVVLERLDNKNITCNWAFGHVYNMFTQYEIQTKAHPQNFDVWMYGLQNDSSVFESHYIILSNWDRKRLNNSMYNYNLIENTTLISVYEVTQ